MADTATPAKAKVLVVDDSSLVRLYYRSALETAGFEVKQAINGIEAMEKVLSESFDLVIVDVNMPRMDGFTFLRSLRSSAADVATLPALMISTAIPLASNDFCSRAGNADEAKRPRPAPSESPNTTILIGLV